MKRLNAWRRRQPSRILYVPILEPGSTIVAAGLRRSSKPRLRMIEAFR